jgi:hypothetical protein
MALLAVFALVSCSKSDSNSAASSTSTNTLSIQVLSGRADLVSGDDALVQLNLPSGVALSSLVVDVGGRVISSAFAQHENGLIQGLVTGLALGDNVLTAKLPDGSGAKITLTNHANGGPIIAGPQVQPWTCASGAVDAQCNQAPVYSYFYKSSTYADFAAYDPANPPAVIATTTTDQNVTVPYIVRLETGHQDRGQYQIAVLYDPSRDWQPWAPQTGWNGKVITPGGSSCGSAHGEGNNPTVLTDYMLRLGFAVMSSSLFDNNQNCNMVVQAESLIMLKEHFIETYGPIRYTIGTGCSGGSIYQQQNANAYGGLLDGIIPQCSFPDTFTTAREVEDCALLLNYWGDPSLWGTGISWTEDEEIAVTGHPRLTSCQSWVSSGFNAALNPQLVPTSATQNCKVDVSLTWTPENPTGVRCDLPSYMYSIMGPRPQDGYANSPVNNYGVQYGLGALKAGTISAEQFVDINTKIGSHDVNYFLQSVRSDADVPALLVGYNGGLINQANLLPGVPMIDLRGHDTVDIHLDYHSFEMRARLDRANGNHNNQIIWFSPIILAGDPSWAVDSLAVIDKWLAAIEADKRSVSLATKVADNKPADATDRCYSASGEILGDLTACKGNIAQYSQNPRMVAGEAVTNDDYRCQLKPISAADYLPAVLTSTQLDALRATFPDGVCDYSKSGLYQQGNLPWSTYAAGPGGKPLGDAPVSTPLS